MWDWKYSISSCSIRCPNRKNINITFLSTLATFPSDPKETRIALVGNTRPGKSLTAFQNPNMTAEYLVFISLYNTVMETDLGCSTFFIRFLSRVTTIIITDKEWAKLQRNLCACQNTTVNLHTLNISPLPSFVGATTISLICLVVSLKINTCDEAFSSAVLISCWIQLTCDVLISPSSWASHEQWTADFYNKNTIQ